MQTSALTILLLASLIGNMPGQTVRPPNLHTNHLSAVVRSPFSSVTNPAPRQVSHSVLALPLRLNPTNRLASPAVTARPAPRPVLRQLKPGVDSARADFGLHKVGFAGNLAVNRSVGITTPDNQPLTFRPTWLAYYDTASGRCVLLATIQDCSGAVQWPDRAIYPNAFSGLNADAQYVCTPNSLEQNIILRQRPPAPESYGLNPDTTRLQVWTEWFDAPPMRGQSSVLRLRAATNGLSAVTANDLALNFGTMKIVRGMAFNLNGTSSPAPVAKEWVQNQGRNFLVETVDYRAIKPSLQTLTASTSTSLQKTFASREQLLQTLTANVAPPAASRAMQVARADAEPAPGVVLDFTIIDTLPLPAGAVAWWPANGDASDVVGGHDGTLQGGADFGAGEVGQGFVLDGSSGYVSVPDNSAWAFGNNDFTIELWANFADYPSDEEGQPDGGVFISSDAGGGNANKWFFALAGGVLNFHINDPVNGPVFLLNTGFTPDLNTWYHLAVTRSGNTYTVYVNGVAAGWDTCARTIPGSGAPLMIGQAEGFYFNGSLDEATLYHRALSDAEISAIYAAGGAGKENPNCVAPASNAIGWWAGDGNADDLVGADNGTLQGGATYSAGEAGSAFDLDGSSGYVQVPDNDAWAFGDNDFTVEFWVNFRDLPEYDSLYYPDAIFVANDQGGGDQNKWMFDLSDGVLTLLTDDPQNWVRFIGQAPFTPDPNTWYHLALVREGTDITIYVNGEPAGTDTINVPIANANAPLTIGQAEGIGYVNGQIDEMTIYHRALSGSEISAIYSAGVAGKCKTDLDFDGLPDWWEMQYFGNLNQSGSDYDAYGNTLLSDYQNGFDPHTGLPDSWLLNYFGNLNHSATESDARGNTLLYDYQNGLDPNLIQFTIESPNDYVVNTTTAAVQLNVTAGTPGCYALFVNSTATTNWLPFTTTNLTVNLGPTDGVYQVMVGLRGPAANATPTWDDYSFTLDRVAPTNTITNPAGITPAGVVVIKPYLQLQGFANEQLASLSYDISNAAGTFTNQPGYVTDQGFDTNRFDFTTNYFQCYDVPLTNGVNSLTVRVTDLAGNTSMTNFNVILDYTTATTPPVLNMIWPQDGMSVSGGSFTLRGTMSDETGTIVARVEDEDNNVSTVDGLVERNGMFWVEDLPLSDGDNTVTVTATDAAGNVTTTSMTVSESDVGLTIVSTPTGNGLCQPSGTVSGTISVSDPTSWSVSVNGTNAEVNDSGYWEADNVPINGSGTAVFDAVAMPPSNLTPPPPPVHNSATVEVPPHVVITSYHDTKNASSLISQHGESETTTGKKDYTANYQTDSTGQWVLHDYSGERDISTMPVTWMAW